MWIINIKVYSDTGFAEIANAQDRSSYIAYQKIYVCLTSVVSFFFTPDTRGKSTAELQMLYHKQPKIDVKHEEDDDVGK